MWLIIYNKDFDVMVLNVFTCIFVDLMESSPSM